MVKTGVFLIFIILEGSLSSTWADNYYVDSLSDSPYSLNWVLDGGATIVSTGVFALGRVLYKSKPNPSVEEIKNLDRNSIFIIDRYMMADYSAEIDWISDVTKDISVSLPILLIGTSFWQYCVIKEKRSGMPSPEEALLERIGEIVVMYYESLMLALGIKDSLKGLITRFRPYAYGSVWDVEKISATSDSTCSFPSGHTTAAFTGAVFLSTMFSDYYPNSPVRFPVWLTSILLATATGALRVASGNHFFTDVVGGAVIGTLSVLSVRYLHLVIRLH